MTNQRLESFRTAFQNFDIVPLVTPAQLDQFRVEYGGEIITELEQLVADCLPNDNKIIFTGHRGSGKSTLLGQFCRQIKDDYFVVFFSISMQIFEDILFKRLSPDLIEPEAVKTMILKSGGALREFIRIARQCCQICSLELRKKPELQNLIINNEILQKAVTDLRITMTEPLGQNAFEILVHVYNEYTPADGMDQTFLDLLHELYILEYRNNDLWFGINPIVKELLELRGSI